MPEARYFWPIFPFGEYSDLTLVRVVSGMPGASSCLVHERLGIFPYKCSNPHTAHREQWTRVTKCGQNLAARRPRLLESRKSASDKVKEWRWRMQWWRRRSRP